MEYKTLISILNKLNIKDGQKIICQIPCAEFEIIDIKKDRENNIIFVLQHGANYDDNDGDIAL